MLILRFVCYLRKIFQKPVSLAFFRSLRRKHVSVSLSHLNDYPMKKKKKESGLRFKRYTDALRCFSLFILLSQISFSTQIIVRSTPGLIPYHMLFSLSLCVFCGEISLDFLFIENQTHL